jgi:Ni/Co efflux regulator RcnB
LIAATAFSLLAAPAFAQNWNNNRHDDHHGNSMMMMRHDNHRDHRNEWHKGSHIDRNVWNRGARVDYRQHHLSRPPRGYEWRRVDDNYVLAAVATGVIASILLANN